MHRFNRSMVCVRVTIRVITDALRLVRLIGSPEVQTAIKWFERLINDLFSN